MSYSICKIGEITSLADSHMSLLEIDVPRIGFLSE